MDTGILCWGVKRPGRDTDSSPPVLKMIGAIPLLSLYAIVACIKTTSCFTFVIISVYWFTYFILRNQCFDSETNSFGFLCVLHAHTHIVWTSTSFRNTNIQWLDPAAGSYKPKNGCHSRFWVNHCIAPLNGGVVRRSEISVFVLIFQHGEKA